MKISLKEKIEKLVKVHKIFSEKFFVFVILTLFFFFIGKGFVFVWSMHKLLPLVFSCLFSFLLIGISEKAAKKNQREIIPGSTQAIFFYLKDKFFKNKGEG